MQRAHGRLDFRAGIRVRPFGQRRAKAHDKFCFEHAHQVARKRDVRPVRQNPRLRQPTSNRMIDLNVLLPGGTGRRDLETGDGLTAGFACERLQR